MGKAHRNARPRETALSRGRAAREPWQARRDAPGLPYRQFVALAPAAAMAAARVLKSRQRITSRRWP
jgi:hypothetical protein